MRPFGIIASRSASSSRAAVPIARTTRLGWSRRMALRAPRDRLSPVRGSGRRGRAGAVVCRDAAVREFLPTSFKLAAKGRDGALVRKRYHPPSDTLSTPVGGSEDEREGATPGEPSARHVGPVRLLRKI